MSIEAERQTPREATPSLEGAAKVQPERSDVRQQINDVLVCWVYGSSAAGKETFIRNVTAETPEAQQLRGLLGWEAKDLEVIETSIQHIGQSTGDPSVENRDAILEKVEQLKGRTDLVILIKGQSVDLWGEESRVGRVRDMTPNADQQIIFLHVPLDELLKRCKRKSWWNDEYAAGGIERIRADLVDRQLPYLIRLSEGRFEIIALANNEDGYHQTSFPPTIE